MKKLLFIIMLISTASFGQSNKVKQMLKSISGEYEFDNNGNVTYTEIVDLPGLDKDEIYNRAHNYFVYNYNSGKDVIQIDDKESGQLVGKGIFPNVHTGGFPVLEFDVYHILRIDVKDEKARVILSLTEYQTKSSEYTINEGIASNYPFSNITIQKSAFGKAFYYAHKKAQNFLEKIQSKLIEGNIVVGDDDW